MNLVEEKNLAGCCGSYCGLCPRYQSTAKSRCPGCKVLSLTISCRIFNCCVKGRGFVTCGECGDFPCEKNNPEIFKRDTFVTRKVYVPNIRRIQEVGLRRWLEEQIERRGVLEHLLENYDEGRSRTFYCTAAALMPIDLLEKAVGEAEKTLAKGGIDDSDRKEKARIFRAVLQDFASRSDIDLKLRRDRE